MVTLDKDVASRMFREVPFAELLERAGAPSHGLADLCRQLEKQQGLTPRMVARLSVCLLPWSAQLYVYYQFHNSCPPIFA